MDTPATNSDRRHREHGTEQPRSAGEGGRGAAGHALEDVQEAPRPLPSSLSTAQDEVSQLVRSGLEQLSQVTRKHSQKTAGKEARLTGDVRAAGMAEAHAACTLGDHGYEGTAGEAGKGSGTKPDLQTPKPT